MPVKLNENSNRLTTMITPFGRYRWARLPFGLKVSSEIFQRKLTEAVGDLNGTFTIADDIIIADVVKPTKRLSVITRRNFASCMNDAKNKKSF